MTDRSRDLSNDEARVDRWLREAYDSPDALPREFESEVMGRIRARPRHWLSSRAVFAVMVVYWTLAASVSAWLILGGEAGPPSVQMLGIAGFLVVLCLAPLWWMMRQVGAQFAPLLLRTLQQETP